MKRIKVLTILVLISIAAFTQEKGSYVGIAAGGGITGFNYDLKGINSNGKNKHLLGANALIDYSYYFSTHWGISLGAGVSYYRTSGLYEGNSANYFNLGNQVDDDPLIIADNNYQLRARLLNWEERQTGYLLDIPVMLKYQTKLGKKQRHGVYFGIGAKVQIPIQVDYKIIDSEYSNNASDMMLNVSGYYTNSNMEIGSPDKLPVPQHGFGSIYNPNEKLGWNGSIALKPSYSGVAEAGFLFGLTRRMDLTVGAYFEYGFNDIKKGDSKDLMTAPKNYLPNAANNVGKNISYSGMINSKQVDKVNLLSYGAKVGLRVKIGKLTEKDPFDENSYKNTNAPVVIIQKDTCCPKGYGSNSSAGNGSGSEGDGLENALKRIEDLMREMLDRQTDPNKTMMGGQNNPNNGGNNFVTSEISGLKLKDHDVIVQRIYFDYGSSEIKDEDKNVLDEKIAVLNANPGTKLRILGNTCDISGDKVNVPLGLKRAEAAKQYFIDKGLSPDRLIIATQSSNDPLLPNTCEENRAQNRRCDFIIVKGE